MKTTFCAVGTRVKTGTVPVAESRTGLPAGGRGAAGSGVRPHLRQAAAAPEPLNAEAVGDFGEFREAPGPIDPSLCRVAAVISDFLAGQ